MGVCNSGEYHKPTLGKIKKAWCSHNSNIDSTGGWMPHWCWPMLSSAPIFLEYENQKPHVHHTKRYSPFITSIGKSLAYCFSMSDSIISILWRVMSVGSWCCVLMAACFGPPHSGFAMSSRRQITIRINHQEPLYKQYEQQPFRFMPININVFVRQSV